MSPVAWVKEWIDHTVLPYASLWALWGIAMYLNQIRKWKPFKIWAFCINIFVAGWIWVVMKDFIPESLWGLQYSLVSIAWFLAFPILDFLEEKWLTLFIDRILWKKQ